MGEPGSSGVRFRIAAKRWRVGGRSFPLLSAPLLLMLALSAFRIEGESVGLSAGGSKLVITHLGFSISEIPSSGSEGWEGRGWSECWELQGRKQKIDGAKVGGRERECV